jgi:hypothetical protein
VCTPRSPAARKPCGRDAARAPGQEPSLLGWVAACTAAELLGFAGAALWAWLALSLFGVEPASWAARLSVLCGVLAGALMGLSVALATARALAQLASRAA